MSKKMMKRTVALSALIAVALSGTVFAASITKNLNGQDVTYADNSQTGFYAVNSMESVTITGTGAETVTLNGVGKQIALGAYGYTADRTATLRNVKDIVVTGQWGPGNVFYAQGQKATVTVDIKGDLTTDKFVDSMMFHGQDKGTVIVKANSINIGKTDSNIIVAQNGGTVDIDVADDFIVETEKYSAVTTFNNNANVTITAGDTVSITAETTALSAGAAPNEGEEATIAINAKNIILDSDANAISAKSNAVVAVNADKDVTINGTVLAQAGTDATKVAITGENITINADGARGVNAKNGTAVDVAGKAVIDLGDDNTKAININDASYGLIAQYNGTAINVKGDALNIDGGKTSGANGIWAMNGNLTDTNAADNAKITIDKGTTTTIKNVDSAIMATSQGTVDIAGDLYATATNEVIGARGGSTVNINSAGDKDTVVQLKGDIVYELDKKDVHPVNATVNVNLTNSDSWFKGNIYKNEVALAAGSPTSDVTGMNLGLSNGATWTSDDDSFVNNLTVDDGNIVMNGDGQHIDIDTLKGEGGSVTTDSLQNQIVVTTNKTTYMNGYGSEAITAALEGDDTATVNDYLKALADTGITEKDGKTIYTNLQLEEGALLGATTAQVGSDGSITNIVTRENRANGGLIDMTALSLMTWRGENDDLVSRLGDLRKADGERGIWTRMARGQQSYNTVANQYNMYQIGYDQEAGDWTVGAAYSYTDGKSWFDKGSGENTHNVFSLYGTKMNDNGSFIDLVAKYGNLDYEYDLLGGVGGGDYDTDAYSFSVETGKRITSANGAWVEPQVQLTYGMVDDVAFKTRNGFGVQLDSVDSFVARAGVMAGKPFAKGDIYLKASYLYDFAGEVEGTFSNRAGRSVDISRDLGGGWWEVGFGTNFNLSDVTYMYLDFEKAFGGEVDVEWKWNAGVRYSF